jgi:NCS1 family nucleobase:cation symporter-1
MTAMLLVWAVKEAKGFGPLLAQPGKFRTMGEFFPIFVPSLTAMIGYCATLSLNMPDFTRFGRSQREQVIGQVVALPTTMSAFAAMGVLITSATILIYGHPIWDPMHLARQFKAPLVIAISMFMAVATLAVTIAANVVSRQRLLQRLPPLDPFQDGRSITPRTAMRPGGSGRPVPVHLSWLVGYSGTRLNRHVFIADYWLVRKKRLKLEDLYHARHLATPAVELKAVVATLAGCALAGAVVSKLKPLYSYAWFVGSSSRERLLGLNSSRSCRDDGAAGPDRQF